MPGAKNAPVSGIGRACCISSVIVPVRSDKESAPAGEIVSIPRSKCVVPDRPSRLAIGVIVLEGAVAIEPARTNVADRVVEKVGAWNVSLRRMRWCTI